MSNSPVYAKPDSFIGVGLRHLHYDDALNHDNSLAPIDFVEIHAENFFAKGGITQALLLDVREKYELSVHGTSLGLGSNVAVPQNTLSQFADLVRRTEPKLVSEHLCFNRAMLNDKIYHSGDLLPIPFNNASLAKTVDNIQQVQDAIGRPLLIENLSAYLNPSDVPGTLKSAAKDSMSEPEFLIQLCEQAGCGMLLDLNNLIVNALNQGQAPAQVIEHVMQHVLQLPANVVGEIHLAGFSEQKVAGFIIDDHGQAVSSQCWLLYQKVLEHFPNVPTLIEWDTNLPAWETLVSQATQARCIAHERRVIGGQ
jgi:uncharacterized protein (UPF0276 family)